MPRIRLAAREAPPVTKLSGAIVNLLKNVLTIVVLFFLVIAVARWSSAHPAQFQQVLNSVAAALVNVITWITGWINSTLAAS